jgi:hypothetical protein
MGIKKAVSGNAEPIATPNAATRSEANGKIRSPDRISDHLQRCESRTTFVKKRNIAMKQRKYVTSPTEMTPLKKTSRWSVEAMYFKTS